MVVIYVLSGGQQGVWGYKGLAGGVWGGRGVLGASRECRYSVARRDIGGIRGYWGAPRGCWANSDITVASSSKSYHKIWCHTPTLSLDISKIFNVFYFY